MDPGAGIAVRYPVQWGCRQKALERNRQSNGGRPQQDFEDAKSKIPPHNKDAMDAIKILFFKACVTSR
jgi:hypothetical protein